MLASAQTPDQALASAAADANHSIEECNQRVTDRPGSSSEVSACQDHAFF
jgi:hypothetical protein